jgi:hypothetical protein
VKNLRALPGSSAVPNWRFIARSSKPIAMNVAVMVDDHGGTREELAKLRHEIRQLKLEWDILSKAAAWLAQVTAPSQNALRIHDRNDTELRALIRSIYEHSHRTCGVRCVHAKLREAGGIVSGVNASHA